MRKYPYSLICLLILAALSSSGCYMSHLAVGQLRVVCSRVELDDALASDDLSREDKDKLRFVQEVKRFAEVRIGLSQSCNYSKYLPGAKKPIVHVVTGVRKKDLEKKTWWFPIVGTVSYKGFFNLPLAHQERAELMKDGYDVYIRPAVAFSTLGWFCDPVIPTMLDLSDHELAALITHELVHTTLYVPDDTYFNESLATFVGHEGAVQFFDAKFGPGNARSAALREAQGNGGELADFMRRLDARLRTLYANKWHDTAARRELIFAHARQELNQLCVARGMLHSLCRSEAELNTAVVSANLAYGTDDEFRRLYDQSGRDWRRFFAAVRRLRPGT